MKRSALLDALRIQNCVFFLICAFFPVIQNAGYADSHFRCATNQWQKTLLFISFLLSRAIFLLNAASRSIAVFSRKFLDQNVSGVRENVARAVKGLVLSSDSPVRGTDGIQ